jgi:hypothetical protein
MGGADENISAVPEKTVLAPETICSWSFEQKSVARPLTEPFADWVQVPGVSVKAEIDADPVLVRVTVVAVESPGSIARSPPYLLIVEHVALFVEMPPPSVELQTELPEDSCNEMVPDPAVFAEFVIDAVKAATAGLMDPARTSEANTPQSAAIRARRFTLCVKSKPS